MGRHLRVCALAVAAIALAGASRPWTQERFSQCLVRIGTSALDPDEGVSSIQCREPDKLTNDNTSVADLRSDRYVFVGWDKKQPHIWAAGLMLMFDYSRSQTIVGGDAAGGFVGFNRVTILWPDGLQEYQLKTNDLKVTGCSAIGSGLLRTSTCSYRETAYFSITRDVLELFRKAAQAGATTKLPMKFFSISGGTVEAYIYADEVVATAAAAGI